jgi:tetratricopeptide (TPR) repeat protein
MMASLPAKLLAFFGNEADDSSLPGIDNFLRRGYSLLAIDSIAMMFARKADILYSTIENWVDPDVLFRCGILAMEHEVSWYQMRREDFTAEGICWPEFDRYAMSIFWTEVTAASLFMEEFLQKGGEDIQFLVPPSEKYSLYYYQADTWKTIVNIFMGRYRPEFCKARFKQNIDRPVLMEALGQSPYKELTFLSPVPDDKIEPGGCLSNYRYVHNIVPGNKIIFAVNPGELFRFEPVIKDLASHTDKEITVYLLSHDSEGAKKWTEQFGVTVLPAPRPIDIDQSLADRFYKAYSNACKDSTDKLWDMPMSISYHFKHYCVERWPRLEAQLRAWRHTWEKERPAAVLVSSLRDTESQLPAEAANYLGIETFSVPHARFDSTRGLRSSKTILYDFKPVGEYQLKKGIAPERCVLSSRIIGDYTYPTEVKSGFVSAGKVAILVLVGSTIYFGRDNNLFIPPVFWGEFISSLKSLSSPPPHIRDRIDIKFKMIPIYPELELLELAGIDRDKYVLPIKSDLFHVLDDTDLVVDLNFGSVSAIVNSILKVKPVVFFWNKLILHPEMPVEALLEAGELVPDISSFWRVVEQFLNDSEFARELRTRVSEFREKYLDVEKYPPFFEVIKERISRNTDLSGGLEGKKLLSKAAEFLDQNEFEKARELYKTLLITNAGCPDALNNLGYIEAIRNSDEAAGLFRSALQIEPAHLYARENLYCLLQKGSGSQYAESSELLDRKHRDVSSKPFKNERCSMVSAPVKQTVPLGKKLNKITSFLKPGLVKLKFEDIVPDSEKIPYTLIDYLHDYGDVPLNELIVLLKIVRAAGPSVMFEIGTFLGGTTLQFAANSNADIYTLDLPPAGHQDYKQPEIFDKDLDVYPDTPGKKFIGSPCEKRIKQLYGNSQTYDFSPYHGKIDIVFVDASHHYEDVRNDSINALKMVKEGGIILWHDYASYAPGVVRAIEDISAGVSLIHIEGTSLVFHAAQQSGVAGTEAGSGAPDAEECIIFINKIMTMGINELESLGKLPEVLSFVELAVRSHPQSLKLRCLQAEFKIKTGDIAGAREILFDVLKISPGCVDALTHLAFIEILGKNCHAANEFIRDALILDPMNENALKYLEHIGSTGYAESNEVAVRE